MNCPIRIIKVTNVWQAWWFVVIYVKGEAHQRIRQQLKKHQIDAELASDGLAEVDWFAEALATKVKKYGAEVATDPKLKAKQIRFLQYRGYSMDVIFKVIQFDVDHNEDF